MLLKYGKQRIISLETISGDRFAPAFRAPQHLLGLPKSISPKFLPDLCITPSKAGYKE